MKLLETQLSNNRLDVSLLKSTKNIIWNEPEMFYGLWEYLII